MKLPLKYFLLASVLLGAVALPWGYKYLKARREAEIERLSKELEQLRLLPRPGSMAVMMAAMGDEEFRVLTEQDERRIEEIEARLEQLTGNKPNPNGGAGDDSLQSDPQQGFDSYPVLSEIPE